MFLYTFARCEGLPDGPCPANRQDNAVQLGTGDLMLCADCNNTRILVSATAEAPTASAAAITAAVVPATVRRISTRASITKSNTRPASNWLDAAQLKPISVCYQPPKQQHRSVLEVEIVTGDVSSLISETCLSFADKPSLTVTATDVDHQPRDSPRSQSIRS